MIKLNHQACATPARAAVSTIMRQTAPAAKTAEPTLSVIGVIMGCAVGILLIYVKQLTVKRRMDAMGRETVRRRADSAYIRSYRMVN
jgi:hypothetical protein